MCGDRKASILVPADLQAGEVVPGDVAAYTVTGAKPVDRSADVDVARGRCVVCGLAWLWDCLWLCRNHVETFAIYS